MRSGRAFFDESLAVLVEIGLPVVANAHPRYFEDRQLPAHFDARVEVPRLTADGLTRILDRRIGVATEGSASTAHVFDDHAVTAIFRLYVDERASIRRVIQLVSEALIEAVEAGQDQVGPGAVANAIAALR